MFDREKKFTLDLIKFYKGFLLGSAESVGMLAKIEKKYPKEYKLLKEVKDDPTAITELTKKMNDKEKDVFILTVVEASQLGQKMNKLFDLSQKDKESLAKEIEIFAEKVEVKLKDLVKNDK